MKKPEIILFDYGQTLVNEKHIDGLKGLRAVLNEASHNPNHVTAEEIRALSDEINQELSRFADNPNKELGIEIHQHVLHQYLYEYFGVEFTKSPLEVEQVFEHAAFIAEPTKHVKGFLEFLHGAGIRSGVVSNISFSGAMLRERVNRYLPDHHFEFIIASSEYIFRKPNRRIFELALRKADIGAEDAWYIGDNAVFDVDGAANCGILPVWYKGAVNQSNRYVPKTKCLEIDDWDDLKKMLSE